MDLVSRTLHKEGIVLNIAQKQDAIYLIFIVNNFLIINDLSVKSPCWKL